MFFYIILRSN